MNLSCNEFKYQEAALEQQSTHLKTAKQKLKIDPKN